MASHLNRRRAALISTLAFALASVPTFAQAPASAQKPALKTATKPYAPPRTPWGDPDLQGNYTNLYEAGTPLERPDQFAGRKLEDVTGAELADVKRAIQERTIQQFETPFDAPSNWWQDAYRLDRGKQAWLIVDPEDGKIPPLTPEAQARDASRAQARQASGRGPADSYEDRSLYDRCLTRGFPTSGMPTIYGNSSRIVQGPGYVAIQYEMIHETRLIPIEPVNTVNPVNKAHAHVGGTLHLDMGDPRGHWEGDTLVVETTNFRARSVYRNANADTLRFIERFTPIARDKVRWSVTVDDPKTWTRPWTFSMPLTMTDSEPIMQYECHEGNYGLRNILSAARAQETGQ
jgi:hypothetical protein